MCLLDLTPRALLLALFAAVSAVVLLVPGQAEAFQPRVPDEFFGTSDPVLFDLARDQSPRLNSEAAAIHAGGLGFVRLTLDWQAIEPQAPVGGVHGYAWSTPDRLVAALARNDLSMVPSLWSTPWWARNIGDVAAGCRQNSALDPSRVGDYGSYAHAVAARYGTGGSFWSAHPELPYKPIQQIEIWNEPNWGSFYCLHPDPAAFADLAVAAGAGIRSADPRIETATGGLVLTKRTQTYVDGSVRAMPPGQFLSEAVAARPDLPGVIDSIGIHPYDLDPDADISLLGWMRHQLAGGPLANKSFLITEFGWHTSGAGDTATESERAEKFTSLTDQLARTDCRITGIAVHAWTTAESNPANADDWYGIADPDDESLYPSGRAYTDVVALYEGKGSQPAPRRTVRVCGGPLPDQDGDGTPDASDDYPLDPTRSTGSGEVVDEGRPTAAPTLPPRVPADYFAVSDSYMPASEPIRTSHYDEMGSLGVGAIRETVDWHIIERDASAPRPAERFDWADLDRREVAYARRGISLSFNEINSPLWLAGDPGSSDRRFAEFASALAARYGTGGSFWQENQNLDPGLAARDYEIWTAANTSTGNWLGTTFSPAQYAATYATARAALKSADPQSRAIVSLGDGGDGSSSADFLRGMVTADPSLSGSIDGVYVSLIQARSVVSLESAIAKVRSALDETGNPAAKLYVGFGAPTSGAGSMSETDRAAFVREAADAMPRIDCMVDRAVLYGWTSAQTNPVSYWDWFGVVDPTTARPTTTAVDYQAVAASYGGYEQAPADPAALHPCDEPAPDRDGDGVDDAVDPAPLDATIPSDAPVGSLDLTLRRAPKHATRRRVAWFRYAADGASSYQCKFDSRPFRACGPSIVLRKVHDGRHRIAIRAVGASGTTGTPVTYRWLVDTKGPTIRFRGQRSFRGAGHVRVAFKAKDRTGVRNVRCRIDGRAWHRCRSPWRTSRLGAGRHRLQVRAADRLGNVATAKRFLRVKKRG
jgi:hypothetical protein